MRIKKLLPIVTSLVFLLALVLVPAAPASASLFSGSRDAACNGAQLDSSNSTSSTNSTFNENAGALAGENPNTPTSSIGAAVGNAASGNSATSTTCGTKSADTVSTLIVVGFNLLSFVVGILAVIMIMVGGLRYITAGGEPAQLTSARNTIIYAIIGLVVAALAQVIVRFVLFKIFDRSGWLGNLAKQVYH